MKELYMDAELEIVNFSATDVITTSGEDEATETTAWVPYENMGEPDWNAWG